MEGAPKMPEMPNDEEIKVEKTEDLSVPEKIKTIQDLIKAILVPGMLEATRLHLMREWTTEQEAAVQTSRDTIVLNINRAKLYELVGDKEGALDCLWEAKYQAEQEDENELHAEIFRKIQEI